MKNLTQQVASLSTEINNTKEKNAQVTAVATHLAPQLLANCVPQVQDENHR